MEPPLFGNEFRFYLNPCCVSSLFLHPPIKMSFSVDDLVSSLSESHISQEANDIAILQVNAFFRDETSACSLI